MELLRLKSGEDQLDAIARLVCSHLLQKDFFALALVGELGAGKTSMVRQMIYVLGLGETNPILSPTFSYIHDYQVNDDLYAHLDLYRCEGRVRLEDFIAYDYFDYRGLFIEWPDRLEDNETSIFTHKLTISSNGLQLDQRLYELEAMSFDPKMLHKFSL